MEKEIIEQRIQHFMELRNTKTGTINAMLEMELYAYDLEQKTITLAFPVCTWEANPVGNMHGGMICAILDVTMGCAAYVFSQAYFTPTIQMSVNFVKGIPSDEVLLVEGILDHAGSRMAQARAIARLQRTNEVAATGNGSYAMNHKK